MPLFHKTITDVLQNCSATRFYEIIFVDDGSSDDTLNKIKDISSKDTHTTYASFSRNFGKEAAIYAGFKKSRGDYVALMDVDLQDPPALLTQMFTFLVDNPEYDLTGCRRTDRKGENAVTSLFSDAFYKVMGALTDVNVVSGARDFHVMRRYVTDAILSLQEENRFSKGIFGWVGFKCKWFDYHNVERVAGQTKWSFWKLLRYSIDGITAFSSKPLALSSMLGVASIFIAFVLCVVIIVRKVLYGDPSRGWPSLVCIIFFIGGLQLFTVGILGTYISKIFTEVKRRPLYIIKEETKMECSDKTENWGGGGNLLALFIVVPCYNEEEVLSSTAASLLQKLHSLMQQNIISPASRITFVNDGSTDATWQIICDLHKNNLLIDGISLSCNRGHQNALLAGLMTVYKSADAVISIDADLQDDIDAIDEMVQKFQAGSDVVYGVRSDRATDSRFKRVTAQGFYKVVNALGGECVYNHADYRLMSRRALDALSSFKEVNLFLRGLVPLVGFKHDFVYYTRHPRLAGKSKYPLHKMLSFAFDGITSLSIRPMTIILGVGFVCTIVSIAIMCYFVVRHFTGNTVPGWASLAVSIWFLGGLQVCALGIIGYYVGKTYMEAKSRPRYIIKEYIHNDTPPV